MQDQQAFRGRLDGARAPISVVRKKPLSKQDSGAGQLRAANTCPSILRFHGKISLWKTYQHRSNCRSLISRPVFTNIISTVEVFPYRRVEHTYLESDHLPCSGTFLDHDPENDLLTLGLRLVKLSGYAWSSYIWAPAMFSFNAG